MPREPVADVPCLDLSEGRLWRGGHQVPVTPTLLALLRHMALNPNRLVTKQELLDRVWPDTHVTDELVKDYVRKARKALDDDARQPRFIETARGMGYRLIGRIDVMGAADSLPHHTAAQVPTIAVLPFDDASSDSDQAHFAAGITEDIIAELSRFRSLMIIARDSTFFYDAGSADLGDVAQALNADHILKGSVRRDGAKVRVRTQLVEAATGACIWAEHYDRRLDDIFAVQDEISRSVASTLVGHLDDFGRRRAARKQPESLEVYECLLLGDWHLRQGTKEDVLRARRMYERAIDMEPANARAHAELAFSYLHEFWSEWTTGPAAAADTAFALASTAVALDDLDSRAHLYLAVAYHYAKSDFDAAAREYERADRLNPNDYDIYCLKSWLLALAGEAEEGWSCAERAIRMSPLTTEDCRAAQCFAAYGAKRYDDALTSLRAIPGPTNEVNAFLAMCCAQLGRDTEAKTAMARFLAVAERDNGDFPGTDSGRWRAYWRVRYPFKHADDFEHVMQGLRKAGLP